MELAGVSGGQPGALQFLQGTTPPTPPANTVQLNAPTSVTAYNLTLPGAQGAGALTNDGSGNLSFTPSVTQITAGTNVTISPSGGTGNVTINASGGGSGTVSGQANGVIPLATASTIIGAQSALSDNGTTITSTEPVHAPSFVGSGSDPFVNYPTNSTHSCTAGDLFNNAGVLTFCPSTTRVPVATYPTIVTKKGTGSASYTTTSTSFVAVDGTNLSYAITIPSGSKLTITATFSVYTSGTGGSTVALLDGSTEIPGTEGYLASGVTYAGDSIAQAVVVGDGASHTITLQFKTGTSGTTSIINYANNVPSMIFRLEQSN
jgi:plastocyanin